MGCRRSPTDREKGDMKPTKVLQEMRKMGFEEALERWNAGRLTRAEAARIASQFLFNQDSAASVKGCRMPALNRRTTGYRNTCRAGVGQASRDETA